MRLRAAGCQGWGYQRRAGDAAAARTPEPTAGSGYPRPATGAGGARCFQGVKPGTRRLDAAVRGDALPPSAASVLASLRGMLLSVRRVSEQPTSPGRQVIS